jgi:hypothetical protein
LQFERIAIDDESWVCYRDCSGAWRIWSLILWNSFATFRRFHRAVREFASPISFSMLNYMERTQLCLRIAIISIGQKFCCFFELLFLRRLLFFSGIWQADWSDDIEKWKACRHSFRSKRGCLKCYTSNIERWFKKSGKQPEALPSCLVSLIILEEQKQWRLLAAVRNYIRELKRYFLWLTLYTWGYSFYQKDRRLHLKNRSLRNCRSRFHRNWHFIELRSFLRQFDLHKSINLAARSAAKYFPTCISLDGS